MRKAFAFDLGKVLFDFDYSLALEKIKDKLGVSPNCVIDALFFDDFALDFEKGIISGYDFYLKFKESFKAKISYSEFVDSWCRIFSPNNTVVELIRRLRILYPVYLISNINELHFDYLYQQWKEIFLLFDKLFLSFKIKAVKPEKKIYEELFKEGFLPEEIIYIDDRQDLIEEGKKLGLRCIQFRDSKDLIKDLEKDGIYILNDEEHQQLVKIKEKLETAKNPLIIGIGNIIRGDDGAGTILTSQLKDRLKIEVIEAELNIEGYLSKMERHDFILILDSCFFEDNSKFKVFSPSQVKEDLSFTHNFSLKYISSYLQKEKKIDILILGIKPYNLDIKMGLSKEVEEIKEILKQFFLRNFSLR